MEQHLRDREFFVGDRPTAADVALYVYPCICDETATYGPEGFPAVRARMGRISDQRGYVPPPGW